MRIYTRTGDDGTTGLRQGVRVRKDAALIEAIGTIDEAQACLGLARAEASGPLAELLAATERGLWVTMAELAAAPGREGVPEVSAVTEGMVEQLEAAIDSYAQTVELAPHFAVPGENRLAAALDLARTVVRRAERRVVACDPTAPLVGIYLNRLADLCFILARASEADHPVQRRRGGARGEGDPPGGGPD